MQNKITSGLYLLLALLGFTRLAHAQYGGGANITGTIVGTTSTVSNYGSIVTQCTYRFSVSVPGSCFPNAFTWSLPGGTTGVTVQGGSWNSSTIDLSFSSAASSYQRLTVQVGSYCSGYGGNPGTNTSSSGSMILFVGTFSPGGGILTASANPICANTPLTLSMTGVPGATTVDWSGNGQSFTTTNAANNFAWTISSGISTATTFQATIRGCGYATATKTITVTPSVELASSQVAGERDVVASNNQGSVTLTNYKGAIQYWQSSTDNGASWTTIAQTTEEVAYDNLTQTTLYRAVTSVCGVNYTSGSCVIRVHPYTDDLSWTQTKTFAADGTTLTSDGRTYVDGFAKPLQSQSKNLSQGKVLVAQPLYGKYDQAVGSTLAAPITPTEFTYTPSFITPTSKPTAAYDYTRFDDATTLNSPEAVSNSSPGTLGWYYSTNNTQESRTASTNYPYSRTDAVADGSTGVSRAAGPAPGLQLGSTLGGRTHEVVQGTFAVRNELDDYAGIRQALLSAAALGAQPTNMKQAAVQRLGKDADGNSTLVFADKEGRAVMSARPATSADAWATTTNTVEVGWPYSAQSSYFGAPLSFEAVSDLMMYDSQGQWVATGTPEDIARALATSPAYRSYFFYSNDPFTVQGSGTGVTTAQWREAYAFFNFYVAGDGSATITNQPATPNIEYEVLNSITGTTASFTGSTTLGPGCYQVRTKKGTISLTYTNRFKDISYSFYNQKGHVVETIAPKGVKQLLQDWLANGPVGLTASFVSTFEYDQQGRQTAMNETDAGRTEFFYRTDGKLRFSQNAKQRVAGYFSYVNYDNIGRPIEDGENVSAVFANLKANSGVLDYVAIGGDCEEGAMGSSRRRNVVFTYYDQPVTGATLPAGYTPAFLHGRVAGTRKDDYFVPCVGRNLISRTWYSYDEQGRGQWIIKQQYDGTPLRTIDYAYDAAGNVGTVCYQKNVPGERLTHYYSYDADSRLSLVQTDRVDPVNSIPAARTEHARYSYYTHGPLKRVVYGRDLQGVDYTYTATGQLKALNDGDIQRDPGLDGTGATDVVYKDFLGINLNYYPNDYTSAATPAMTTTTVSGTNYQPHYNGLVSATTWQTPGSAANAYGYNYDEKGQLLTAAYGLMATTGNRQYSFIPDNANRYGENLPSTLTAPAYDANGNIGRLQRTDGASTGALNMDGNYQYVGQTNKLDKITVAGNDVVKYQYNEIGQVTSQQEADPTKTKYLEYDASGRVTAIYADAGRTMRVALYAYDEYGKRLSQTVYPNPADKSISIRTTFVRDASGNELASYVQEGGAFASILYEQPIYGARRLGIYRQARGQEPAEQLYELNDQLGNTRIVFRRPATTTYALSMEDNRVGQEKQDFPDLGSTAYDNVRSNDIALPNSPYNTASTSGMHYSMRLSGMQLSGMQSPTKTIAAQRGDKLHLSVYAYYEQFTNYPGPNPPQLETQRSNKSVVVGAITLGSVAINPMLGTAPLPERSLTGQPRSINQIGAAISIPLFSGITKQVKPAAQGTTSKGSATINAQLQYNVLRASDRQVLRSGTASVPAIAYQWNQLALDVTITESEPVLVEVFAINNDATTTYFDDLTIDYTPGPVIEENHFYAYGQRLDGLSWRRTDERLYGRGYQGQYTTQDAESGYTAFDLRMYDTHYGRWLMNDPMRQHFSGYLGMGNNPVSMIDPTGGEDGDLPVRNGVPTVDLPNIKITGSRPNDAPAWAYMAVKHPAMPLTNYYRTGAEPNPFAPWNPQAVGAEISSSLVLYNTGFSFKLGLAVANGQGMLYGNGDYGFNMAKPNVSLPGKFHESLSLSLFFSEKTGPDSPSASLEPLTAFSTYSNLAMGKVGFGRSAGLNDAYKVDDRGYTTYSMSFYPEPSYGYSFGQNYTYSIMRGNPLSFLNP